MFIKVKKNKDIKTIEIKSNLMETIEYTCRKRRARWYSIIKLYN